MGEIRKITNDDRRSYENYHWSITDPNTPKRESLGVIARIFRRSKNTKRRWTWIQKPK